MRNPTSTLHRSSRRASRIASLALATALLCGIATPARAGSHFENGYEDQLGRLLAFETVAVGRALLFPGVAASYPAPAAYPAPAVYPQPVPYPVPVAVPVAVPRPWYGPAYAARGYGYGPRHYHHHCGH